MTKQKEVITAQDNVIKAKYTELVKHRNKTMTLGLKLRNLTTISANIKRKQKMLLQRYPKC